MNIINDKNIFIAQAKNLLADEDNLYANLSNISALYKSYLPDTNWIGFYLVDNNKNNLVLGPFQGNVACVRIPFDKGVCGHCYTTKTFTYVPDVHKFSGHIACDSQTNSELVIPIIKNNNVVALLDIDSIKFDRFSNDEVSTLVYVTNEIFSNMKFNI